MEEQPSLRKSKAENHVNRLAWGVGRIFFMAHFERIQKLVDAGYSNLAIYQKLEGKLGGLSYSQFSHHIRKRMIEPRRHAPLSAPPPEPVGKKNPETKVISNPPRFQRGPNLPNSNELI